MEEKERKAVNTNLGILLICLFSSLFTLIDFIVIDRALDKYVDCSNCTKCEIKESGTISGNTDNTPVVEDKKNSYSFGNENFSCLEESKSECLVFNDDNLNVKIVREYLDQYNYNLYLEINGNAYKLEHDYVYSHIYDIKKLDDGYLYALIDTDPNYSDVLIFNYDGEVVTDLNDKSVQTIRGTSYEDGYFYTLEKNLPDNEQLCKQYGENDVIAVSRSYKYLGAGLVDDGTLVKEHTTLDRIKEMNVNSCEEWLARFNY